MTHVSGSMRQSEFRIRNDNGSETTATWVAALNTNANIILDTTFRLRITLQEFAGGSANAGFALYYSRNGGGYAAVTTATPVRFVTSGNVSDGQATTSQLSGTGIFTAGVIESAGDGTGSISIAANDHTELEFVLQFPTGSANAGDVFTFQVWLDTATALTSYTATPSITAASPTPAVLSSPTATSITQTTATVGATTDQVSGTMYAVATASATPPSATQIKAGQDHTGATALGANSTSVVTAVETIDLSGLPDNALTYYYIVQNNAAGDSNIVSGSFSTLAYVPPVLSLPTATSITYTSAIIGASINDASAATMYGVVTTSATPPSAAQIQAGQDHTGAAAIGSGSNASLSNGPNDIPEITTLSAGTQYWYYLVATNAYGSSNIVSNTFTTVAVENFVRDFTENVVTSDIDFDGVAVEAFKFKQGYYRWFNDTSKRFNDMQFLPFDIGKETVAKYLNEYYFVRTNVTPTELYKFSDSFEEISWVADITLTNGAVLEKIVFGNGVFVAINSGATGTDLTSSTDLVTWTVRDPDFTGAAVLNVDFFKGVFIAIGSSGRISTSTDGITWTPRTSGTTTSLTKLFEDPTHIYVYNTNASITLRSTDGVAWEDVSTTVNPSAWTVLWIYYDSATSLYYLSNNFTNGYLYTASTIGSWTNVVITSTDFGLTGAIQVIGKAGDMVVALSTNYMLYTLDGVNYNIVYHTAREGTAYGYFFELGRYTGLEISVIRDNWAALPNKSITVNINDTYNLRMSIETALNVSSDSIRPRLYFSRNGEAYEEVTTTNDSIQYYASTNYIDGADVSDKYLLELPNSEITTQWVEGMSRTTTALYADADILVSALSADMPLYSYVNGKRIYSNFEVLVKNGGTKNCFIYQNGIYIIGGDSGFLATSYDGVEWISRDSTFGSTAVAKIFYVNGLFIIQGVSKVATSTNGITWTAHTYTTPATVNSMLYANGYYCFVGSSATFTQDFVNYTNINPFSPSNLSQGVAFNDVFYFYSSASSSGRYTSDGITFTPFDITLNSSVSALGSGIVNKVESSTAAFYYDSTTTTVRRTLNGIDWNDYETITPPSASHTILNYYSDSAMVLSSSLSPAVRINKPVKFTTINGKVVSDNTTVPLISMSGYERLEMVYTIKALKPGNYTFKIKNDTADLTEYTVLPLLIVLDDYLNEVEFFKFLG